MGLDMYLQKVRRDEVAYWRKANAIHDWFNRECEKETGTELENCQSFPVSKEQLVELKNTCKKVLDSSKLVIKTVCTGEKYNKETGKFEKIYGPGKVLEDPSIAQELLPTTSGFFFGSTEYDEWYVEDLKSTIEQIDKILETTDFDECSIEYHAWW